MQAVVDNLVQTARARQEADFLAYQEFERQRPREIVAADEAIPRAQVEAQAHQLVEAFTPVEKQLRPNEAEDNARTALFEALTASGHLSTVELPGDIDDVHRQVVTRLLNGYYRPNIESHERDRVFQEICEELTIQQTFEAMLRGDMPGNTKITTISDFAHPLGSKAAEHGYRPDNQKGMIRETSLIWRDGRPVRIIRQISRSNTYAPTTLLNLEQAGVKLPMRSGESDVRLLGSQLLSVQKGALEVVELLDRIQGGVNVRYGDIITEETPDYDQVERLSAAREAEVEPHVQELAKCEKQLSERVKRGEITEAESLQHYVDKTRDIVRAVCVKFPGYVKDALGADVVATYHRAHELHEKGDYAGAAAAVTATEHLEQAIIVCGASSKNNNEAQSIEQEIAALLATLDWKHGRCRVCLRDTMVGSCTVCRSCQTADDAGHSLERIHAKALRGQRRQQQRQRHLAQRSFSGLRRPADSWYRRERTERQMLRTHYGVYAEKRRVLGVGAAKHVVRHRWTGEQLG